MDLRRSASELDRDLSRIAWETWTPAYTSTGGPSPTVTTNVAAYLTLGKMIWFNLDFSVTALNGATGTILVTLPTGPTPATSVMIIGHGREGSVLNHMLVAYWSTASSRLSIISQNGGNLLVVGYRPTVGGAYRIA